MQFGQIHLSIRTNIFVNSDNYILHIPIITMISVSVSLWKNWHIFWYIFKATAKPGSLWAKRKQINRMLHVAVKNMWAWMIYWKRPLHVKSPASWGAKDKGMYTSEYTYHMLPCILTCYRRHVHMWGISVKLCEHDENMKNIWVLLKT